MREPFEDQDHPGNGSQHHTGKRCIEDECTKPAGTAWSPLWCFHHNAERMRRIAARLAEMAEKIAEPAAERLP